MRLLVSEKLMQRRRSRSADVLLSLNIKTLQFKEPTVIFADQLFDLAYSVVYMVEDFPKSG